MHLKEQTPHQKRFSEAVRDAIGTAKTKARNICIGYSPTEDRLFLSDENCIEAEAIQATITPTGDIREARNINPLFCEV